MSLDFTTLDIFTKTKYSGNPVAIVHVPSSNPISQTQKQLIAREFNLSETVFLHDQTESDIAPQSVRIDIFTSIAEVPFAGHPTVGTANYLLHYLKDDLRFRDVKALQTKAGKVSIAKRGNGIELHVTHDIHVHESPIGNTKWGHHPVVSIVKGMTFILARCANLDELGKQNENLLDTKHTYTSQDKLDEGWKEGILCTYFFVDMGLEDDDAGPTRVIRTRMFGSREDPATGSAASALCSWLSLQSGSIQQKYHIIQAVEMGRRSDIYIQVTLKEDGKSVEDVLLSGDAVKVMDGRVDVPPESE